MNTSDPNSIINALSTLSNSLSNQPTPAISIPTLGFNAPTGNDINAQYQQFLNDAANDPNLINYYNQLLSYAQGDTNLAIQQLQTDYNTGVRQTTENLQNSLSQLGLTFTGEQNSLLDQLNQRGIALTQNPNGSLSYGGGGESQTELQNLNSSQALRQQAQQKSAQQSIENAGLSLNKGITSANEALQNQAISLQQSKQQDITNRANTNFQGWQNQQNFNAQMALQKQQMAMAGGGTGSAPPMPTPGAYPNVGTIQSGYRWNGKGWDPA